MEQVKSLIKLTNLKSESLNEKEQSRLMGGHCICGCFYADCGGSSRHDNASANRADNAHSQIPGHGEHSAFQE